MSMNSRSSAALIALVGLALAISATVALAGEPIPGVDVKLGKNPGGALVAVASSDAAGRFTARVAAPGRYTVSFSCKKGPCQPLTVQISASGKPLKASPDMTYDLSVGDREIVVISGTIQKAQTREANSTMQGVATTR